MNYPNVYGQGPLNRLRRYPGAPGMQPNFGQNPQPAQQTPSYPTYNVNDPTLSAGSPSSDMAQPPPGGITVGVETDPGYYQRNGYKKKQVGNTWYWVPDDGSGNVPKYSAGFGQTPAPAPQPNTQPNYSFF